MIVIRHMISVGMDLNQDDGNDANDFISFVEKHAWRNILQFKCKKRFMDAIELFKPLTHDNLEKVDSSFASLLNNDEFHWLTRTNMCLPIGDNWFLRESRRKVTLKEMYTDDNRLVSRNTLVWDGSSPIKDLTDWSLDRNVSEFLTRSWITQKKQEVFPSSPATTQQSSPIKPVPIGKRLPPSGTLQSQQSSKDSEQMRPPQEDQMTLQKAQPPTVKVAALAVKV